MIEFHTRLATARTKAMYTQVAVAKKLGVHRTSVWGWENGSNRPTYEHLVEMAKLYNVTTDYLLGADPRRVLVLDSDLTADDMDMIEATVAAMIEKMKKR